MSYSAPFPWTPLTLVSDGSVVEYLAPLLIFPDTYGHVPSCFSHRPPPNKRHSIADSTVGAKEAARLGDRWLPGIGTSSPSLNVLHDTEPAPC